MSAIYYSNVQFCMIKERDFFLKYIWDNFQKTYILMRNIGKNLLHCLIPNISESYNIYLKMLWFTSVKFSSLHLVLKLWQFVLPFSLCISSFNSWHYLPKFILLDCFCWCLFELYNDRKWGEKTTEWILYQTSLEDSSKFLSWYHLCALMKCIPKVDLWCLAGSISSYFSALLEISVLYPLQSSCSSSKISET